MGQNTENWDFCLKNVSAGVLTFSILYHVSQEQGFALPPLHGGLFPQPWKLQALKCQDTQSFCNSQRNYSVYRPTEPITTIFPILAFCYIWFTWFLAFSSNLQFHKILIPKAPQDPLIPGDGALRKKTPEAARKSKPFPTALGCVLYISQHHKGFMCLFPMKRKSRFTLDKVTSDNHLPPSKDD